MPEITDAYLAEIEARLNAATPGPWEYFEHSNLLLAENAELVIGDGGCDVGPAHTEDGHLIAHAPADLAALLAEVRRLRGQIEDLEVSLRDAEDRADTAYTHGYNIAKHGGYKI